MDEFKDLVWKMFEITGEVGLYCLYKELEKDAIMEETEQEELNIGDTKVNQVVSKPVLCGEREL